MKPSEKVETERQCMIYHARGEFFSESLTILCGQAGSRSIYMITTSYGRKWEFDSTK
jgi:hypothetical protein